MAVFLQSLCVRLGVLTGKDLSQASRAFLPSWMNICLFILAEIAIIATDLAEVIGGAIALQLLFGISLKYGIMITCLDVLLILAFWNDKYQKGFEFIIFLIVLAVGGCFVALVTKTQPDWHAVGQGYIPSTEIFTNGKMLYIALGIMGATVMPHNLYIHSHLCAPKEQETKMTTTLEQMKSFDGLPLKPTRKEQSRQIGLRILETILALTCAVLVNSGILIVAASAFYTKGRTDVAEINDAFGLLVEYFGKPYGIVFAVALLLCSQSSTITGTIAGQIIVEGHLGKDFNIPAWIRRLITRLLAIVPAMLAAWIGGDSSVNQLLVLSQVVLSLQLPFAVWPLVYFTSSSKIMEAEYNDVDLLDLDDLDKPLKKQSLIMTFTGCLIALILTILNCIMLFQVIQGVE
jgi:manganese transport protein